MSSPAGWYPQSDGRQRYWDGEVWTERFKGAVTAETMSLPLLRTEQRAAPSGRTFSKAALFGWGSLAFIVLMGAVGSGLNRPGSGGGSDSTERWGHASTEEVSDELRERAQRMVAESMSEDPALTLNGAVKRIGPRVGVVPDTLRGWVKQAAIDAGQRLGVTSPEASRVKELEREVKELKSANEILLAASSFFARELDPRLPW